MKKKFETIDLSSDEETPTKQETKISQPKKKGKAKSTTPPAPAKPKEISQAEDAAFVKATPEILMLGPKKVVKGTSYFQVNGICTKT
jgi:hypothetical protein